VWQRGGKVVVPDQDAQGNPIMPSGVDQRKRGRQEASMDDGEDSGYEQADGEHADATPDLSGNHRASDPSIVHYLPKSAIL
jgi:hypothetical protein